jgi:four helix bundle protein
MSPTITRFEDLECWREARTLALIIYRLTKGDGFDQDRELRWQLRAAAVSPMSNIAEAHGRNSFEDKWRFFDIALGSCKEVQNHLYVALDQTYIVADEFHEAYGQAERVAQLVAGSLTNLERQIAARPLQRVRSRARRR